MGWRMGRRLRCLAIVDDCTRECVAIEVDISIIGARVKAVLERLADLRGCRARSPWITVRSSKARCSMPGHTSAACICRSSDPQRDGDCRCLEALRVRETGSRLAVAKRGLAEVLKIRFRINGGERASRLVSAHRRLIDLLGYSSRMEGGYDSWAAIGAETKGTASALFTLPTPCA
jgi:hypothetical protein